MDRECAPHATSMSEATLNTTPVPASTEELDEDMWKSPPLSASNPLHQKLGDLDNSLRCPCCRDFFRNPVSVVPCHHTFCSECIRSHFKSCSARTSRTAFCPSCKEKINTNLPDHKYLIPNRSIQKISESYQSLRGGLRRSLCELACNQTVASAAPASETLAATCDVDNQNRSSRKSPRLQKSQNYADNEETPLERKHEEQTGEETQPRLRKRPTVLYKLLNRKRLVELCAKDGLNTSGTDKELRARHEEFLNLYNAECDSFCPRSVAQLVAEVGKRERARRAESNRSKFRDADKCMNQLTRSRAAAANEPSTEITSGNAAFDAEMKANFAKLIEDGRRRAGKSANRPENADGNTTTNASNVSVSEEDNSAIASLVPGKTTESTASPVALTSSIEATVPADESRNQRPSTEGSQSNLAVIPAHGTPASSEPKSTVSSSSEATQPIARVESASVESMSQRSSNASPQSSLPSVPTQTPLKSSGFNTFFASTPIVSDFSKRLRAEMPNSKKSSDKRQKRSQTHKWQCRRCTLINSTHARFPPKCAACGEKGSLDDTPNPVVTIDV